MASRGRRGGVPAREGERRREEQTEQQAPAPQGPILPLPPPVDYGVFMQGLVQAMQMQAHTQAALQAQMEAQALSAACRQEGEMEQYLEEKKALQKRPATLFHSKVLSGVDTSQLCVDTSAMAQHKDFRNDSSRHSSTVCRH
ncbi:hypothetical protein Taro_043306 [Colocasia esculenta]|uniref:Uncharacterized protein n=1 Tax=Colocasia esculenta TaxID=4460 RepID=A0A843X190_COLES|nr:hypothetical protein [Colocasia esculenta]